MSEILGTLLKYLAALIAVASVVLVSNQAYESYKTSSATADLTTLVTGIQKLYLTKPAFTTLGASAVINGGIAPQDMINGTALINQWGGAVTLNVNSSNANLFDVTENLVPGDACANFVSTMSSAVLLKLNSVVQVLPMDPGTVAATCGTSGNTLVFTFTH